MEQLSNVSKVALHWGQKKAISVIWWNGGASWNGASWNGRVGSAGGCRRMTPFTRGPVRSLHMSPVGTLQIRANTSRHN